MSQRVSSKKTVFAIFLLTICLIPGVFADSAMARQKSIEVRLDGATEYEASEVMGKILNNTTGILEAKRYGANIVSNNPKASWSTWRVTYDGTDPSRLQSNIMRTINQVQGAGGKLTFKGVPYRYSATEVKLLKSIRPGRATNLKVQFVFKH